MISGTKKTLLDNDLVDEVIDQFTKSMAAEFTCAGGATAFKEVVVSLIPRNLIDYVEGKGLLVVVGNVAFRWDGREALNQFNLTTKGIRPLSLAAELAAFLPAIVKQMTELRIAAQSAPLQITHQE